VNTNQVKSLNSKSNILFLIFLAIGFALRLYQLGDLDYWYDEMVSVHFADLPNWSSVLWDNSPPLYPFILKIWVRLFNDSEAITRYLSVLFSMGSFSVLWFFANRRTALFYLLSVLSLSCARETRPYALYELFAVINLVVLSRTMKARTTPSRFFLSQIGLALTHYFAAIPILVENLFLFFKRRKKVFLIFPILICSVAIYFFLSQLKIESLSWMKLRYKIQPNGWSPLPIYLQLANGSGLIVAAFFSGIIWDIRKWKKQNDFSRYLIILLLGPLFILSIASGLSDYAFLLPKYFIFLVPAFLFYLNGKIDHLPKAKLRNIVILAFVALSLPSLKGVYNEARAPWSAVTDLIAASSHPAVYTTRSVGIGSPYLQRHSIQVQKLQLSRPGMDQISNDLQNHKTVWILETQTAAANYIDSLSQFFKPKYKVESHFVSTNQEDQAVVIKIYAQ
jgi:uncharacterized membrane protein